MMQPPPSMPSGTDSENKLKCIKRFQDWWPDATLLRLQIRSVLPSDNPQNLLDLIENNGEDKITNVQVLAELLYDVVGPNFLQQIYADEKKKKTKEFRKSIFQACIKQNEFEEKDIVKAAKNNAYFLSPENINSLDDVVRMNIGGKWSKEIIRWLDLPTETIETPPKGDKPPKMEVIEPNKDLKPLHDYQIDASRQIQKILEGENPEKRLLISIPTGAGKTRLVVETMVKWLNEGKRISPEQQKRSKYIFWIAQSHELCEQAISEFKHIFQNKGHTPVTIHRLYADNHSLQNVIDENAEQGIIVATINKLYSEIKSDELPQDDLEEDANDKDDNKKEKLTMEAFYNDSKYQTIRDVTACIVIDEAHRAITKMYTRVLGGFGFNYRKKNKDEWNEKKIDLVGLTATAFRGSGMQKHEEIDLKNDEKCVVCDRVMKKGEKARMSTKLQNVYWHMTCSHLSEETKTLYRRFSEPYFPTIYDITSSKKPTAIIDCPGEIYEGETIRISGERSFDNDSIIIKYTWHITRESSLADEILGQSKERTPLANPKPNAEIDYEFKEPGEYEIALIVENKEGGLKKITTTLSVKPKDIENQKEGVELQKELLRSLIRREILCDVYHGVIDGASIRLLKPDSQSTKRGQEITSATKKILGKDPIRNNTILETIHYLVTKCNRKKILVFACGQTHARLLALVLKAKYGLVADFVDSKVSPRQRIEKIEQFRRGELQVLCNTDILTTGFDVPDIDCVIMARPAKSTVLYTQMIGRGMRGIKMGGSTDMWLLDLDDQVQLSPEYQNEIIELGWKSFRHLWLDLKDCSDKDGNQIDIAFATEKLLNTRLQESQTKPQIKKTQGKNPNIVDGALRAWEKMRSPKWLRENPDSKIAKQILAKKKQEEQRRKQEDINLLEHQCKNCKTITRGIDELIDIFPISKEEIPLLEALFKDKKLESELEKEVELCRKCKSISNEEPERVEQASLNLEVHNEGLKVESECPFVKYITDQTHFQSNWQFELGLYLLKCQRRNIRPDYYQAIAKLKDANVGKYKFDDVFDVYKKYGLIELKEKERDIIELTVKKILDPNLFQKILMEKYEKSGWFEKTKEIDVDEKRQLENHFVFLRTKLLGHIPTSREFREYSGMEYEIMEKLYGSYHEFLESMNLRLTEAPKLREKLFDEYLELYLSVHRKITETELDEFGRFRLSDYNEAFSDINEFFGFVDKILERVNNCTSISDKDLYDDYENIKETVDHEPTFDDILTHSKHGIEYYLRNHGTLSRFKRVVGLPIDDQKVIKKLEHDFFEIRDELDMQPTLEQMKRHSEYGSSIERIFGTFDDFLKHIGELEEKQE